MLGSTLPAAQAPEHFTKVLPSEIAGIAPDKMLEASLLKQAFTALDKRDIAFEALKATEQLQQWQNDRRKDFLAALGEFPERTPLNARITGRLKFPGYRVEKILFESQPGFHVTATLYLPEGSGPHPAAVHPTGHSAGAKAAEVYQLASICLVKNGIATLCYDPVGQGERRQYLGPGLKPSFGTTTEHSLMDVGCTLLGTNVARYMLWDGMRAVDYLQSRADIDPSRIGLAGISGGGTMSSYLGALDDRIAVSAPGCYLTGFRRLLETIGPQDAEQNLFAQITAGLDHGDYVMLRAPRPTLIMAATRDFFDIAGTWHLARQSKRFYSRMGFPERVDILEADTLHGFPSEMRIGAARWLRRWFFGSDSPVGEPEATVLKEAELQTTPEGQVLQIPGEKSLAALNQEWEARLKPLRSQIWTDREAALAQVRKISRIRPIGEIPEPVVETGLKEQRTGYTVVQTILKPDSGVWLPAVFYEPEAANRKGVPLLYLHEKGKQAGAAPGGEIERLVLSGASVFAVDLSGTGETERPAAQSPEGMLLGANSRAATLAYLLGKSIAAMRAEDVLVCARHLLGNPREGQRFSKIGALAVGDLGVSVLHAAALEPRLFETVTIRESLASWTDVVRAPAPKNQRCSVIFGALRAYDLSDLADSLPAGTLHSTAPREAGESPSR
jgi:hypothetical protein